MGLVSKLISFGALDLGTWMHTAMEQWYKKGRKRHVLSLAELFSVAADNAIINAQEKGAPDHTIEKAEELAELGVVMAEAYQAHYGNDEAINVIGAEIPLAFSIADKSGKVIAQHLLKPDLVFYDGERNVLLLENKTAKQIATGHLAMDDQARPYGVMAERALKNAGIISQNAKLKGILYNFLRKGIPDERMTNDKGQSLNKNGTVSARQPKPMFVRKLVTLTTAAKRVSLRRIQTETVLVTELTTRLRSGEIDPADLPKTPHKSCERFCQYFDMCVAEENGIDIRSMQQLMFVRRNPYDYAESTDEPIGFEMG